MHPKNPLVTCANHPDHALQKSGHGDFVWTPEGKCYLVFLVGRPLSKQGRCILGRETAIEEVIWPKEDWPYLASKSHLPRLTIPSLTARRKIGFISEHLDFSTHSLSIHYQSLRIPITNDWCQRETERNALTLYGQQSLSSTWKQSLVARRLQHFSVDYHIALSFHPTNIQQLAGLVCYYNTGHYFYLHLAGDEDGKSRYLNIVRCDNYAYSELLEDPILLGAEKIIHLGISWRGADLSFFYSLDGQNWTTLAEGQDASILSDDYVRDGSDRYRPAFTGAFVGICCQDLSGQRHPAHFKHLHYTENHYTNNENISLFQQT